MLSLFSQINWYYTHSGIQWNCKFSNWIATNYANWSELEFHRLIRVHYTFINNKLIFKNFIISDISFGYAMNFKLQYVLDDAFNRWRSGFLWFRCSYRTVFDWKLLCIVPCLITMKCCMHFYTFKLVIVFTWIFIIFAIQMKFNISFIVLR